MEISVEMFKNEKLEMLINAMPAKPEKLPLTMLFVAIDEYLNGTLTEEDFLNDLKVLLKKEE